MVRLKVSNGTIKVSNGTIKVSNFLYLQKYSLFIKCNYINGLEDFSWREE